MLLFLFFDICKPLRKARLAFFALFQDCSGIIPELFQAPFNRPRQYRTLRCSGIVPDITTKNYTTMKIKGADGHEYNVTGQGQGNFNTVGAAGGIGWIAEKLFNGNLFNGGGCPNGADAPISRYEASMMNEMAGKDSKIALLEAQIYTDQQTDKKVGEAIAHLRRSRLPSIVSRRYSTVLRHQQLSASRGRLTSFTH